MFRYPSRLKTQGALFTTAALIAACGDPEARTDLRPAGDPEVLAVLVLNDSANGLVEAAAFCKANDEKRPSLVGLPDFTTSQVCPENLAEQPPLLTDAAPDTWYVRIMFDELLDPDVEELIPLFDENGLPTGSYTGTIANTQPVTLKCTGVDGMLHDVPYDGYYSPSGNAVTWPLGPSLVVKQAGEFVIPTNSDCEISIKDNVIFDKQGNKVPSGQLGPYKFRVSAIKPILVDPADDSTVDVTAIYGDNFYVQANTAVQDATWCTGANDILFTGAPCSANIDFAITPEPGFCATTGAACTDTAKHCDTADATDVCTPAGVYAYGLRLFGLTPAEFGFGPMGYPETEATYSFEIKNGATLADRCGAVTTFGAPSVDAQTKVTVKTNKMAFKTAGTFTINQGDVPPATRKMKVNFTAPLALTDVDSVTAGFQAGPDIDQTLVTMDPLPFVSGTVQATRLAEVLRTSVENDLFIRGHYKPETEYTFTIKSGAVFKDNYGKSVMQSGDKVIKFKTAKTAITASSPANGATVTKATPTSLTSITFTFTTPMDPTAASWGPDDIEFTGTPTQLTFNTSAAPNTCNSTTATGCQLRIQGTFVPGDYQVKLKQGAVIKDIFGTDYVQASDRIIKFTVKEAAPAPVIPCLGS